MVKPQHAIGTCYSCPTSRFELCIRHTNGIAWASIKHLRKRPRILRVQDACVLFNTAAQNVSPLLVLWSACSPKFLWCFTWLWRTFSRFSFLFFFYLVLILFLALSSQILCICSSAHSSSGQCRAVSDSLASFWKVEPSCGIHERAQRAHGHKICPVHWPRLRGVAKNCCNPPSPTVAEISFVCISFVYTLLFLHRCMKLAANNMIQLIENRAHLSTLWAR